MSDAGTSEKSGKAAKRSKIGCWVQPALMALICIGLGVWLLARWEAVGPVGRVFGIVLVVFGSVIALPVLLWFLFMYWLKRFIGGIGEEFKKAGEGIIGLNKAMYGQVHEFREATDEDYVSKELNRAFYDETEGALAARGFRKLGDLVDRTIEELGHFSPVIRVMMSESGTTGAAFYDISKLVGSTGKPAWACDVGTEFTDGTFLITNNVAGLNMMTPPPKITYQQHAQGTGVAELLEAHEAARVRMVAEGKQCVVIRTLAEAIESEKRQQQVKNEFREGIGYADPAEAERIAQAGGMGDVGGAVADGVREAKEEEDEDKE